MKKGIIIGVIVIIVIIIAVFVYNKMNKPSVKDATKKQSLPSNVRGWDSKGNCYDSYGHIIPGADCSHLKNQQ